MISKIFIGRPIFASVVSIVIMLVGVISMFLLPIDQYPYITPPGVKVSASFSGASADTAADSVAIPLEQALNGVPDMLYMSSSSSKSGSSTIKITFDVGTDADLATVNVQNYSKDADSSLPADVMQDGVSIEKEAAIELIKIAITSDDPKYDDVYLSNFLSINVSDSIRRIPGVGRTRNTGARSYAMRVWLQPDRMAGYGLTTSDVKDAIREQNTEAAAGTLGAQPGNADLTFPIRTLGRLSTAEEFGEIIIRANQDGSMIRLRDLARVELGAKAYKLESKLNGKNAAILQIYMLPGANALKVAEQVKETMDELSKGFPDGVEWDVWFDASTFIKESVKEVAVSLVIALVLVIFVVYIFLQDWRSTLIPITAVPVSIIGTFTALAVLGFSLNTVNLLALVLAIGIVVDDAIVLVENVERLMSEAGLSAAKATARAMEELTGALIATSLVLAAVFVPVSFLPGITGIMYREFALSITVSVIISTLVALTLSPALCALLLRPKDAESKPNLLFALVNRVLDYWGAHYTNAVRSLVKRSKLSYCFFALLIALSAVLFREVPASFMPDEDQGRFFVDLELADGSTVARSKAIVDRATRVVKAHPAVEFVFSLAGESKRSGGNEGSGTLEVVLKDWEARAKAGYTVERVIAELSPQLESFVEVSVRTFTPPAIAGLGTGSGVEMELQDRSGTNAEGLAAMAEALIDVVEKNPAVEEISTALKAEVPLLELSVDRSRAKALGVPLKDIYSTMNDYTGSASVNDLNLFGRVYRVYMQAESEYRDRAESIDLYHVRSSSGAMVPLSVVSDLAYATGPASVDRYNMYQSASISAVPAKGYSTGSVLDAIEEGMAEVQTPGFGYEWTGVTLQEVKSSGQTVIAVALALTFVFLFLSALYESWTVPIAVLLIAPIAFCGALVAVWLRGLDNNLFFQIALISLIGLAAKNSILIVEFSYELYQKGRDPVDAAIEGARLRFRPILMTAFAFIVGVLPLVLSEGPGSMARKSLSTPSFGGMIFASTIGILMVPLFFVSVIRLSEWIRGGRLKPVNADAVGEEVSNEV